MQHRKIDIDSSLLLDCRKGREKALHQLFKLSYGPLFTVCKRYLKDHDEVQMLLNTGFLKIVKGLEKYQISVPFEAWIKRIMINTIIDYHRKHKKYKTTIYYPEDLNGYEGNQVNYNEADQKFDAEQLVDLINRLPPTSASVFNLYAVDGYSHKEIAELLGISIGTSKWHLSNARKKLQHMIQLLSNGSRNKNDNNFAPREPSTILTGGDGKK